MTGLIDALRERYGSQAGAIVLNAKIRISGSDLPDEIIIIPKGRKDGDRIRLDTVARDWRDPIYVADAESIVKAVKKSGRPIPLDVDHNTVWGFGDTRARAQIVDVRSTNGDLPIVGTPRWTAIGRSELTTADGDAPPYSMLSPVLSIDADRNVIDVHSLALTNNAALTSTPILHSIQAQANTPETTPMPDSTPRLPAILLALPALLALGITDDMDPDAANAKIEGLRRERDDAKSKSESLAARVTALEALSIKEARSNMLDKAGSDGKVTPAQRERLEKLGVDNKTLGAIIEIMPTAVSEADRPAAPGGMVNVEHDGKTYKLTASEADELARHKEAGIPMTPEVIIASRTPRG